MESSTGVFIPAESSSLSSILEQYDFVGRSIDFSIFDNMPISVLILNKFRQIVFANKFILKQLNLGSMNNLLGVRPGELLHCTYSQRSPGGCGTSEYCQKCGAVSAILGATSGVATENEAKILVDIEEKMDALTLKVSAFPLVLGDEVFAVIYINDISAVIDRDLYERIFYHDMTNGIAAIISAAKIIGEDTNCEDIREMSVLIKDRAELLINDINGHRLVKSAEQNTLKINPIEFNLSELIALSIGTSAHEAASVGIRFVLDLDDSIVLYTDRSVLLRAVENIVKNAREASSIGQTVDVETYCEAEIGRASCRERV